MSGLRKYDVVGPNAEKLLQLATTRNVATLAESRGSYTLMCDETGFVIDDGTLFRLGEHLFRWCCGTEESGRVLTSLATAHNLHVRVHALDNAMPSFVYLIPVVAFIGAGKPAGVVAIMIFGSSPVIRFTVLGLRQMPETVREAALAFGATPRYLLWRVDLPLASRTIMADVNQTILMSLAKIDF